MTPRFSDHFPPCRKRTHEVTGAGAYAFAAVLAGRLQTQGPNVGPVMWMAENWILETLNPNGLLPFCDPHQLLIVSAPSAVDLLAASEEALRSGVVPLVVAEITAPLTLTAGRRLQLAAEEGRSTGLMIVPEGMGSNAAQTRWLAEPRIRLRAPHALTSWRWSIIKNKAGTNAIWEIDWNAKEHRLSVVAPVGERAVSAPLSN